MDSCLVLIVEEDVQVLIGDYFYTPGTFLSSDMARTEEADLIEVWKQEHNNINL